MEIDLKDIKQQVDFTTHYLISSCKKLQNKYSRFNNIKIEDFDKLLSPYKEYLEIFKAFITYRFFFNNKEKYTIMFLPADITNNSRYYHSMATDEPVVEGCKFYCYEAKYSNCLYPLSDEHKKLIDECFEYCSKLRFEQQIKINDILANNDKSEDKLLNFMRFLDTMQWDNLIR